MKMTSLLSCDTLADNSDIARNTFPMASAVVPSSPMSPIDVNENKENFFHGDLKSTRRMSRPLQPPVKSASQIPASSTRASISSQVASARYVQQYRTLLDRQRLAFDEERALWNIERTELHERIVQLEATVRRYHGSSSSQLSSPTNSNGSASSIKWSLPGMGDPIPSIGDEFWRGAGGKSDAQPTRTFLESSTPSTRVGERLPSIAEDAIAQRSKRSFSNGSHVEAAVPKLGMPSAHTNPNIDGITFKSGGTAPAVVKDLIALQSPSLKPSPSRLSPGFIPLLSNQLGEPHDPYTKDAGHTPLARRSSGVSGAASSEPCTPVQPEMERLPLEPRSSVAKIPSERSNSYFPEVPDIDEDPELQIPLALNNDAAENKSFLDELDSKLEVAKSESLEPTIVHDLEKDEAAENQPEQEPRLRIKRSMNFGSQLGSSARGKGF